MASRLSTPPPPLRPEPRGGLARPRKGTVTKERILEAAVEIASRDGIEGLTIGVLADKLGMSKSGLFAHFGSREALQAATLDAAARRFTDRVAPCLRDEKPGLPRLKRMFKLWLAYIEDPGLPGGCPVAGAITELDDREGPPREMLLTLQLKKREWLLAMVREAVARGELDGATDPALFVFEWNGIMLSLFAARRLLRDPKAAARARAAFTALLERHAPRARRKSA